MFASPPPTEGIIEGPTFPVTAQSPTRCRGAGFGRAGWVLGGYLLLTLAFTYPLIREFGRAIPGDGFDGWQNFWNLWWVRVALLEQHTLPFFTNLLYAPTGVGLLFHTLNPFNGLLALPVQIAVGLFPAYNVATLFSFVMGGLGAYLLARHVLGRHSSRLSAFVAGVIFTFAPFHIAHLLGHMQVISLEWIPFFVLYLLRAVDDGRRMADDERRTTNDADLQSPISNLQNILLAAFFLFLVALCDWYYVLYCLIFTAVVMIWAVWRIVVRDSIDIRTGRDAMEYRSWADWIRGFSWSAGRSNKPAEASSPEQQAGILRTASLLPRPPAPMLRTLAVSAAIWLLWAIALSPLLIPMVSEARQSRFMVPDPAQSRTLSADLLAFITPQEFHPLWGKWAQEQAQVFTASVSEHSIFVGYTVLILAGLGMWAGQRKPSGRLHSGKRGYRTTANRQLSTFRGPWLLALIVFGVLALGPVLHIGGRADLLPGGREIPLPYGWLVQMIPFMDITRSVSRFDAIVMLVMAVLAARGVEWIVCATPFPAREGSRGVRSRPWLVLGLILFEFLPAPYPMSAADTPAWYRDLAADDRGGAVLNLPMNWDRPGYLLYQTEHRKPLTVAYISRDDPRTLTDRVPLLQHLRHLGPDVIAFDLARQGRQVLTDLGVRWVVLDRYKMPGGQERAVTEATAAAVFAGQAPVYADERITVYEVTPPVSRTPYLVLGIGWEPFDKATRTRGFIDSAPIIVRAPDAGMATLRVTLAPGSAALDLPSDGSVSRTAVTLQPGDNTIMLRGRTKGERVIVTELALE